MQTDVVFSGSIFLAHQKLPVISPPLGGDTMSCGEEFKTVETVLACDSPTIGMDALPLTLIKAEREIRKLLTFLVYLHAS